jgi:methyl-accepting chemotaxis protein
MSETGRGMLKGAFPRTDGHCAEDRMRISTKLISFFLGVVILFGGLAAMLLRQLNGVSRGYDGLIEGAIRQADRARIAQVDFKKQVQEWKNILLRGHETADLVRYSKQFHDAEATVRAQAQSLADNLEDPEARALIARFLSAHEIMGATYQRGLDHFASSSGDFKGADRMVRGQDRAPTDLFDQVVTRLDAAVASAVVIQKEAATRSRNLALVMAGGLLALLGLAGFAIVHGVVVRLRRLKEVSDRLALADVDGLVVDISGDDEIGEFGESLRGVHSAIEELTSLATRRSLLS